MKGDVKILRVPGEDVRLHKANIFSDLLKENIASMKGGREQDWGFLFVWQQ